MDPIYADYVGNGVNLVKIENLSLVLMFRVMFDEGNSALSKVLTCAILKEINYYSVLYARNDALNSAHLAFGEQFG